MNDAAKMYELQKVDLTWAKVRRRLLEIQKALGESEELLAARSMAEATEAELQSWQTKQREAESESRELATRIDETDKQLMSGSVHIPKELEALQASADALRRQRSGVEDAAVEAMMHVDELKVQAEEQRSAVSALEAEWKSGQEHLRAEEMKMKQNYALLKRKRENVAAALPAPLLEKYEHMRKRRAGVAVAPVRDAECGACHVSLPTGVISALQGNRDELVLCTSCGRYLFLA
ncbi:MAG: zinc ribbon domain-containing protein [Caldilineaceae bacterium]